MSWCDLAGKRLWLRAPLYSFMAAHVWRTLRGKLHGAVVPLLVLAPRAFVGRWPCHVPSGFMLGTCMQPHCHGCWKDTCYVGLTRMFALPAASVRTSTVFERHLNCGTPERPMDEALATVRLHSSKKAWSYRAAPWFLPEREVDPHHL